MNAWQFVFVIKPSERSEKDLSILLISQRGDPRQRLHKLTRSACSSLDDSMKLLKMREKTREGVEEAKERRKDQKGVLITTQNTLVGLIDSPEWAAGTLPLFNSNCRRLQTTRPLLFGLQSQQHPGRHLGGVRVWAPFFQKLEPPFWVGYYYNHHHHNHHSSRRRHGRGGAPTRPTEGLTDRSSPEKWPRRHQGRKTNNNEWKGCRNGVHSVAGWAILKPLERTINEAS